MTTKKRTQQLYPIQNLDRDVYTLARERTAYIFDTFDHVAVSFSGGKDSTAVLNVALEVLHSDRKRWARHYPLRVVFWDEEVIPFETEHYVRRMCTGRDDINLEWLAIPIQHRNACSRHHPYWWPWAPEIRDKWCRPMPPEATTHLRGFQHNPPEARLTMPHASGLLFPPHLGNCALMMGIRAEESITRNRIVRRNRETNYLIRLNTDDCSTSSGNGWKAYPIYDWSTTDVWTAPWIKGWDYCEAYDLMEMAGMSPSDQRLGPPFGEEPIEGLWRFAQCHPDLWHTMSERVPGVGSAMRYSRTELYGYRKRPPKLDGMTWPDYLAHYVSKHGTYAPKVAERLRELISAHYAATSTPIIEKAPNPHSGVSWQWLLTVAMRGDFKSRKQPKARTKFFGDDLPVVESWHKYAAELAEIMRDGRFDELGHPTPEPSTVGHVVPDYAHPIPNLETTA